MACKEAKIQPVVPHTQSSHTLLETLCVSNKLTE